MITSNIDHRPLPPVLVTVQTVFSFDEIGKNKN